MEYLEFLKSKEIKGVDCGFESQSTMARMIEYENDYVNHPTHYTQGGIECIDAIKAATKGLGGIEAFCTGNAIKYLWRWKNKNGAQDLEKAVWYINRLMDEILGEK